MINNKSVKPTAKTNNRVANNFQKQQSASTKKTIQKNIYNSKIKNNTTLTKNREKQNSDENNQLNSTTEPRNTEPSLKDPKRRLIDILNTNDAMYQENYFVFNKTPSIIEQSPKKSEITILDEFKGETFKNITNGNISSFLNYDLGRSFTSDSGHSDSGDDVYPYNKSIINAGDGDLETYILDKNNLSEINEQKCLFTDHNNNDLSSITKHSLPNIPTRKLFSGTTQNKAHEVSIITDNDYSIIHKIQKLDTSRDSCTYSNTDEVNIL
jgi:hypothetical protein